MRRAKALSFSVSVLCSSRLVTKNCEKVDPIGYNTQFKQRAQRFVFAAFARLWRERAPAARLSRRVAISKLRDQDRVPHPSQQEDIVVKFVSIYAVQLALRERSLWALCAALSTERPVLFGPNLRVLRSDARSDTHSGASTLDQVGGKFSQVIQVMRVKPPKRAPFSHDSSFISPARFRPRSPTLMATPRRGVSLPATGIALLDFIPG